MRGRRSGFGFRDFFACPEPIGYAGVGRLPLRAPAVHKLVVCLSPVLDHRGAAVTVSFIDDEFRLWPAAVQSPRGDRGRGDIAATVDEDAWNAVQAIHTLEDGRFAEAVVGPVVRRETREGQPEAVVFPPLVPLDASGAD